jgi:hypothetical protein
MPVAGEIRLKSPLGDDAITAFRTLGGSGGARPRVAQDDAESYAKREAVAGAQQKRALAVLTGGRAAS